MSIARLEAYKITKYFSDGSRPVLVLDEVTFSADQGVGYAITGASGSGKSTLMYLLAGLDQPTSGAIFFNGAKMADMSSVEHQQWLNQSIGLVFQLPYLIKELTILENVMVPALIARQSHQDAALRAKDLLCRVGLGKRLSYKPVHLSGGQQQRVALARALCNNPLFLLADEPTGNLDAQTGKAIIDLLLSLQERAGMGIIVSTHDAYVAERMAVQYELREGKLSEKK